MVRVCAMPNCGHRMRKYKGLSFHRLPLYDPETLPLWLGVLQLDMQTPFEVLKAKDYRVCSEHFDDDDFSPTSEKCRHLKKNAVPRPMAITTEAVGGAEVNVPEPRRLLLTSPEVEGSDEGSSDSVTYLGYPVIRNRGPLAVLEVKPWSPLSSSPPADAGAPASPLSTTISTVTADSPTPTCQADDDTIATLPLTSVKVDEGVDDWTFDTHSHQEHAHTGTDDRSTPYFRSDKISLQEEVTVQVSCLLQLFDRCLGCSAGSCSVLTRRDGRVFHVTQQCWTCQIIVEWTSHTANTQQETPDYAAGGHLQIKEEEEEKEEFQGEEEQPREEQPREEQCEAGRRKQHTPLTTLEEEEEEERGEEERGEEGVQEIGDVEQAEQEPDQGYGGEQGEEEEREEVQEERGEGHGAEQGEVKDREQDEGGDEEEEERWQEPEREEDKEGEQGRTQEEAEEEGGEREGEREGEEQMHGEMAHEGEEEEEHSKRKKRTIKRRRRDSEEEEEELDEEERKEQRKYEEEAAERLKRWRMYVRKKRKMRRKESDVERDSADEKREGGGEGEEKKEKETQLEDVASSSSSSSEYEYDEDCMEEEDNDDEGEDEEEDDEDEDEDDRRKRRALCPDCGLLFFRRGEEQHVCKPETCPMCGKGCLNARGLRIHITNCHRRAQVCQFCYKWLRCVEEKLEHEESHRDETLKFYCSECPERFRTKKSRSAHKKTHTYICEVCDKGFRNEHHLERHKLVHTGKKPFVCELCDRSFNQDGHLKSHMRMHTGERPFKCPQCERSFNHNVSLKNHLQRHHGAKTGPAQQDQQEASGTQQEGSRTDQSSGTSE